MGTQGLLSITRDDVVLVKVVTGSDGGKIHELADKLRGLRCADPHRIWQLCGDIGLISNSLVVQYAPDAALRVPGDELNTFYATHFHDAKFNPRWPLGTAECVEVLDFSDTLPISTDCRLKCLYRRGRETGHAYGDWRISVKRRSSGCYPRRRKNWNSVCITNVRLPGSDWSATSLKHAKDLIDRGRVKLA